jgi:aryl-alcohol dehydrogenase-like predicted oxidoreductase
MDALADAVAAGLTLAVGVSNYNVRQTQRAYEALARRGIVLASNQVDFSLSQRRVERSGLLSVCKELGVTLIAYSPLDQGLLTGKYSTENPPSGIRGRTVSHRHLAACQELVSLMREIGESHGGKSPAQVALNWVMCKGAVPIPGAKNGAQATENAGAMGWRLSEEAVGRLDEASDRLRL